MAPFSQQTTLAAMVTIIQGERPPRPTHPTLTDGLWQLMQRCWDQDRYNRPPILEVSKALHSTTPSATLQWMFPPPGELGHSDAKDRPLLQWLENFDPFNEEFRPLLYALLSHQDLTTHVQDLQRSELASFVELLDKVSGACIDIHRC